MVSLDPSAVHGDHLDHGERVELRGAAALLAARARAHRRRPLLVLRRGVRSGRHLLPHLRRGDKG